jgi:hypothetical protein
MKMAQTLLTSTSIRPPISPNEDDTASSTALKSLISTTLYIAWDIGESSLISETSLLSLSCIIVGRHL